MMQPSIAIANKKSSTLSRLADDSSPLLLLMVDPDAPTPDMPTTADILHWLAPNMKATTAPQDSGALQGQSVLTNSTPNIVPFAPPAPPATSAAHRYVLYLFEQPSGFTVPKQFTQFSAQNRAGFDLAGFISAATLAEPIAANFLYVSGQQAVSPDFQAPPGGTFPGGNGDAVGLPGSGASAAAAAAPSATGSPAAGAAGAVSSAGAGDLVSSSAGQILTGMGTVGVDGSCSCSVTCSAGSFMEVSMQR